jgi:hypothetical protein
MAGIVSAWLRWLAICGELVEDFELVAQPVTDVPGIDEVLRLRPVVS